MKKLLKPLFAVAIAAVSFTSCMEKDNTDYEAQYRKEEQAIDSILNKQKTQIQDYVASTEAFEGATADTVTFRYQYLDKRTTRGIYYKVVQAPTDNSYEYKLQSNGSQLAYVWPTVKLKYKATLLDGTLVKEDATGTDYSFASANTKIMNQSWVYAFFPYSITFNGDVVPVGGLTKDGLKKGSIFRMVTPSQWAFGARTDVDKVPANSPIVYEFEVLEISNN
ncbi:FKBP-type peptidyl-prolyl cis-trans isomerase [Sphingobacterium suaedae]|uniref:peptidylprolyl isomerase n=1 Tax=Sphingobacterium suaedae TaxID=1686402 RepID=A0ABW5KHG3_9SPHI